jgi:hypothetical protein
LKEKEERGTPQFGERMFIDLTIEDDNEEELGIGNQLESEEDESSSIDSSTENESMVSNVDQDGTIVIIIC